MSTQIVMVGAGGRMGGCICRLVQDAADLVLAGAVDSKEHTPALAHLGCPVSDSLAELLPQAQNAVIIDFTAPANSLTSARLAAQHGRPLVIGTTGFSAEQRAELHLLAARTALFWSANMSIGINVLMKFLPLLAAGLGDTYDMEMVELHHNKKRDSPSGTALSLGECLAQARGWSLDEVRCSARNGIIGERPHRQIGIQAVRGGDVVGVHTIYFMGQGERIEVTHQAHSRENFAQGALRAARWLAAQKPGRLYNMQDILAENMPRDA